MLFDVLLNGATQLGVRLARRGRDGALDDKGLGDLAGAVIGDGDDSAVGDKVVCKEMRLELGRGDLKALFI